MGSRTAVSLPWLVSTDTISSRICRYSPSYDPGTGGTVSVTDAPALATAGGAADAGGAVGNAIAETDGAALAGAPASPTGARCAAPHPTLPRNIQTAKS